MKKILISDYDGTFYQNDKDIKINIDKATEFRQLGNLFVIATGRSYVDLKMQIDKYKIPYDYLILNHGGLVLSKNLDIIEVFTLNKAEVDSILDYVSNNKDVDDTILISTFTKDVKDTSNIVKIMLKLYNYEKASEVKSFVDKNYRNTKSYLVGEDNHYLVEIISSKASKSLMIEKIVTKEKIENKNIFTVGDGINDIDMIKKYNGYRMKTSCKELLSITNKAVNSVSELLDNINK